MTDYLNLEPGSEEIYIEIIDEDLPPTEEIIVKEEFDFDENNDEEPKKSNSRICNTCNQPYKYLSRHLESHSIYNCMDCLLNFGTKSLFEEHIEKFHNLNPNSFSCGLCHLGFASLKDLAVHNFKHTGVYSCPTCKFTVKGKHKHSLINHIKRHEGQFDIFCEICGQGFMGKHFLASHLEIHEAIPKYECEFCKKKFTVKRYLEVHKTLNHKKELYGIEESFQCEICGRKFTFEKSLVRHLSAIHKIGEDRTVACPVCHKIIANNHNLKKHMRIHTGEKRFCCDLCGKAFSEKKYLKKHQAAHERENQRKLKLKQIITNKVGVKGNAFMEDTLDEYLVYAEAPNSNSGEEDPLYGV